MVCFSKKLQLHVFIGCYRSVIFTGSVCLRGDYLNIVFIVVVMDGNNQALPIEFGIGATNNVDPCTWFLMSLHEALRKGREVPFITNMDDAISSCNIMSRVVS